MATLGEVDIDTLHDDYREAVEEMIAAKTAGGEGVAPPEPGEEGGGGQVIDLMAALEKSVREAKETRGETAEVTDVTSRRPAKKTAPAKKTTTKKTTAAKTTATKKTAAAKETTAAKKTPTKKATPKKRTA
ncbi:hypothetical protein [Streptomyces hydrogenans]|uniref:hypothetical protein n=1 Tax=Streptomyces hydrogenans TaxID=1873719 RepID=UPI0036E3DEB4